MTPPAAARPVGPALDASPGALCGGDPGAALTRAFLGLPLDGGPPHDEAGWFGPWARGKAHYWPQGTAHSACWRYERPGGWRHAPAPEPPERPCARCFRRWQRDQQRAARRRG
jgi:hypothetical protein